MLAISCEKDISRQLVYDAEKMFHEAERNFRQVTVKPELITATTLSPVMDKYHTVLEFCLFYIDSLKIDNELDDIRNLESIAYISAEKLARMYNSQKNYQSSVAVLNQMLNSTNLSGTSLLNARSDLAAAFQLSGDWPSALAIYRSLIDTFYPPVDNEGKIIGRIVNLPLRLIRANQMFGFVEEAEQEEISAENYYLRLLQEWPNSDMDKAARSNLSIFYADNKRWDDVINMLSAISDSSGLADIKASIGIAEAYSYGKNDPIKAADIYSELIERESDSTRMAVLNTRLGQMYYEMGEYRQCREVMSNIRDNYRKYYTNDPTPQKYIAKSLEKEGNWERAENEYMWLITNFQQTEAAYNDYLDISNHYQAEGNRRLRDSWLTRGEEFYKEMESRYAGSALEASAISFKAEVYRRRGDWAKAAELLEYLYGRFPNTETGKQALANAAVVYRDKLGQKARADSLLNLITIDK